MSKKETAFWVPPLFDDDGVQISAGIDDQGREHVDPVPYSMPLVDRPQGADMLEMVQRVVHGEYLRRKAEEEGFDTPEEADDFSDEDDYYELSDYQRALMEKDLNPAVSVSKEGKGEVPVGAPPQQVATRPGGEVSRPGGEPVPESVVSSEVGKSGSEEKVERAGSKSR